ncbi:MAG TPA: N-acetyl-alpha-D-glucosaminyl L-malate synthase BshA [Fibrobacteria bacterium]|nr:N-acetyl-alpha-D-glucosaminyl L-malate synthase BshA [Fibrobacteria bacterium]
MTRPIDRPLRIGVTCHPTVGGSGILASELGKFLARRGHAVHFVTMGVPYRLRDDFHENVFFHSVEVERYPMFEHAPYNMALAAKMRDVAEAEGLDLLHAHYAVPHAVSAYLASQMLASRGGRPLPVVTTLHGTDITLVGQDKSFYELTRFAIESSTAVTAVSDYLKRETERVFAPRREIRRIHNFIDAGLFRRSPVHSPAQGHCRRGMFAEGDQVVFMHLSNFRPVKRVEDVVRVFARVAESEDAVLVMIGEGPTQRSARALAESLGVANRVRFLGNQMDVPSLMGCGDVFLFPSEMESFGLAPLEAMACEVPVIASDSGGIPEVVAHGETGFLAPVGDVARMAEYALLLARDPGLRSRMGIAGRRRALELFSPDAMVDQYEALYREVAAP